MENAIKCIGVYTSGGDAPGMNAAIRAVVRTSYYNGKTVKGIWRGYAGMIAGDMTDLDPRSVANVIQKGGTFLKTDRSKEFMTVEGRAQAYAHLRQNGVDALVCIGGNGSYAGALTLSEEHGIPVIGIPGTIDNDLYGTDLTIGFDTAVNTALEAIDRIRDTAHSHQRVFIVEVMGRDSGFIALDVALAGGAEAMLIPEDDKDWDLLLQQLNREGRRKKNFSVFVVAEGDEQGGALLIEKKIRELYPQLDIRSTILGHVQRGGRPSAYDRILASRFGAAAVEKLLQGESKVALGIKGTEVITTPISEAISKHKQVQQDKVRLSRILSI